MTSAIEHSIKEKIRILAKKRETSFAELWRNLILERFLTRLSQSSYKDRFVLKGGALLAKYLPLGRETKDIDFFIHNLSNTQKSLENALQSICSVEIQDCFIFELIKIDPLKHIHMPYEGAQVSILAKFGGTKTLIRLDLGFGDLVEAIDYPIELTSTSKGPLFESKIMIRCYPKEFIFAEKLETVLFRRETNTRMKDFHDLYSLISIGNLNEIYLAKAIQLVFNHRKTSMEGLPITFDESAIYQLDQTWSLYLRKIRTIKNSISLPLSIQEIINSINEWLKQKTGIIK